MDIEKSMLTAISSQHTFGNHPSLLSCSACCKQVAPCLSLMAYFGVIQRQPLLRSSELQPTRVQTLLNSIYTATVLPSFAQLTAEVGSFPSFTLSYEVFLSTSLAPLHDRALPSSPLTCLPYYCFSKSQSRYNFGSLVINPRS
jgi:hypothetical protein